VHTFVEVVKWLTAGEHWHGSNGIPVRVFQHLELTAAGVAAAVLVALPLGLWIGHRRRGTFLVTSIANLGRAIPSFAILVIAYSIFVQLFPKLAFGFVPAFFALWLLAIPPVLINTYVGVMGVDADIVEAARGMGMTERGVLFGLELPLAAPVIMAGLRVATLQVVATATLSALVAGGTLGRYIVDGFATFDTVEEVSGAVLVAALALVVDLIFSQLERVVSPRTHSRARARAPGSEAKAAQAAA
jgi:osmoprotectant transport system permease protein